MGIILLDIATPTTQPQFVSLIHAFVEDHALLRSLDLYSHRQSFSVTFQGAGFTAPIPPSIARWGHEQHHRPFNPCGGIAVLLNQCYLGRLDHVQQIWPQFSGAVLSGRMPSAGLMQVVWGALWLGGAGRPDEQVATQCLLS